jgi:hypothetical protein
MSKFVPDLDAASEQNWQRCVLSLDEENLALLKSIIEEKAQGKWSCKPAGSAQGEPMTIDPKYVFLFEIRSDAIIPRDYKQRPRKTDRGGA